MAGVRRPNLAVEADRRNGEQLARAGREIREARLRRQLTQAQLARRAGVGRMIVSRIERGLGGGVTFDAWQRVALAAGRPLLVGLQRSVDEQPADAAHLAMQELVLRSARRAGFRGSFELSTRPSEPWRSADVGLRDDRRRVLVLVECWNTFGDIGAAARSTDRKRAEGEALARSTWGDGEVRVRSVWVVRDVARNRTLVARYPEVFASRFPGSSLGWTRALTQGMDPPADPGLVWCDVRATRLFARRQRPTGS